MITTSEIFLILSVLAGNILAQKNLYPVYNWKYLDFQFPDAATRNAAIANRQYIKGNSFPIDIDVHFGGFFLNKAELIERDGGPIIAPYPSYSWQQTGNCNGLTSVFRIFIDECERLWVMDSGVINDQQVCPPQLIVFNLKTDAAEFIYKFPSNLIRTGSLFITPVVDVRSTCADTKVYIADVTGFGVVIFDYTTKKAWRAQNRLFYPYPSNSTFTIAGESFDLMDGVFGMSVSPKSYAYNNRYLYFHALAAITENKVPLSALDYAPMWTQNADSSPNSFVVRQVEEQNYNFIFNISEIRQTIGVRENSQSTIEAMDKYGNQFFGTLRPLGIGCWDSSRPYTRDNLKLIVQNDVTLQFISGLKIVTAKNGVQELWVLSCRFQKIFRGTRNINEINYRVQGIPISEALSGSVVCNGPAFPRY